jgi:hypothetical protein
MARKGGEGNSSIREIDVEAFNCSVELPDGQVVNLGPNDQIAFQQVNPKSRNAGVRYETYKTARTVREFVALQLTFIARTSNDMKTDMRHDFAKGFATLPAADAANVKAAAAAPKGPTVQEKQKEKKKKRPKHADPVLEAPPKAARVDAPSSEKSSRKKSKRRPQGVREKASGKDHREVRVRESSTSSSGSSSDRACEKAPEAKAAGAARNLSAPPAQPPSSLDLLAELLGAAGAAEFLAESEMLGDAHEVSPPSRRDPSPAELEANFKRFEARLTQAIGRSAADADRCVKEILRRSFDGAPMGAGLPVVSVEEARLRLIRCGGKAALLRA